MEWFDFTQYYEVLNEFEKAKADYDNLNRKFGFCITAKRNYERFLRSGACTACPYFNKESNWSLGKQNKNGYVKIEWDSLFMDNIEHHVSEVPYNELVKFIESDDYYADVEREKKLKAEKEEFELYIRLKNKYGNDN